MNATRTFFGINRRILLSAVAAPVVLSGLRLSAAQAPLPGGRQRRGRCRRTR
jgi:hypothetical protein